MAAPSEPGEKCWTHYNDALSEARRERKVRHVWQRAGRSETWQKSIRNQGSVRYPFSIHSIHVKCRFYGLFPASILGFGGLCGRDIVASL